MKPVRTLLFICLAATLPGAAQNADKDKISKYYDKNWKEIPMTDAPVYYSEIKKVGKKWEKNDYHFPSYKLFAHGFYRDTSFTIPVDTFYYFHDNGSLESYGKYTEEKKKQGVWRSYYPGGSMKDSVIYENGRPVLSNMSWYRNGYPMDSTSYTADGRSVSVKWFDNGSPYAAGRYDSSGRPVGKWVFFHKSGERSAVERYDNGVLKEKNYFDESGNGMDSAIKDQEAIFSKDKSFSKYLYEELEKKLKDKAERILGTQARLSVIIDEEGNPQNAELLFPTEIRMDMGVSLDSLILDIVNHSPRWTPAVNHNRKVPFTYSLPLRAMSSGGIVIIGNDSIYRKVEIESAYPGGPYSWQRFLNNVLQYPAQALNRNIEGTVVIQFIVDTNGEVTDVQAVSGDPILAKEAIRVIKRSGKWIPAIQNGQKVKSYKKQPLVFKMS